MTASRSELPWVCCDGGPHLLLPTELVRVWEGTAVPSAGRVVHARFRYGGDPAAPATDYDLACDIEGALGVIPVGSGFGLVLGDEVPMSTWLPSPHGTGVDLIIPLAWGALTDGVLRRVSRQVLPESFIDTGLTLDIGSAGATLLPACDSPRVWVYGCVEIPLTPGRYGVASCDYDLEPDHLIRIHRLKQQS